MDLYSIRNELIKGKSIFDIPMRVTFYARVSTDKDEQKNSLDNQIDYYPKYIKEQKNWIYIQGYFDEGISGTKINKREDFLKMIDDAKDGKFDFILTKEISRFARNTVDSIKSTQELLKCGVGVLFESDNINTLLPDSELRLTIMSAIAQDEVRKISERVKFGFKRAIENGRVLGASNIWGYDKDNGKLVINEKEAEVVRLIFNMYVDNRYGMRTIAEKLAEQGHFNRNGRQFSLTTIRYILTNPKYKGYYCGNKITKYDYMLDNVKWKDKKDWVIYEDNKNVPPIVSKELWEKANKIYNSRSEKLTENNSTGYTNKYSYSGKIWCSEHNVLFYRGEYKYKNGNKEVWQCKLFKEKGKQYCNSPTLYTTELNEVLKMSYESLVENKSNILNDMIDEYKLTTKKSDTIKNINKIEKQINDILIKKDKLLDLSIDKTISNEEFKERNIRFNNEVMKLKNELGELRKQEKQNNNYEETIKVLKKSINIELNNIFSEKNMQQIIDDLLDKIVVYKTEDENVVHLKLYFKALKHQDSYDIVKGKKGKKSEVLKHQFDTQYTYH
ncbi:recombinase family protein [Anaerovorax sp. IOR16]|uniref:recombinase family protein n=1 Tax=Anaerovorax sp. IOR16 TaxID=2773458 RepID=UPI0019D1C757|nr:recombinase family protein [Anaerovorax sp. IOR16]